MILLGDVPGPLHKRLIPSPMPLTPALSRAERQTDFPRPPGEGGRRPGEGPVPLSLTTGWPKARVRVPSAQPDRLARSRDTTRTVESPGLYVKASSRITILSSQRSDIPNKHLHRPRSHHRGPPPKPRSPRLCANGLRSRGPEDGRGEGADLFLDGTPTSTGWPAMAWYSPRGIPPRSPVGRRRCSRRCAPSCPRWVDIWSVGWPRLTVRVEPLHLGEPGAGRHRVPGRPRRGRGSTRPGSPRSITRSRSSPGSRPPTRKPRLDARGDRSDDRPAARPARGTGPPGRWTPGPTASKLSHLTGRQLDGDPGDAASAAYSEAISGDFQFLLPGPMARASPVSKGSTGPGTRWRT